VVIFDFDHLLQLYSRVTPGVGLTTANGLVSPASLRPAGTCTRNQRRQATFSNAGLRGAGTVRPESVQAK